MMKTILCLFVAAFSSVVAQKHFPALKDSFAPPPSVLSSTPRPVGNSALWQQAVSIDTAKNLSDANQNVYAQIAWWQGLENSSNSYLAGSLDFDAGPYMSQFLQNFQTYPVDFNQAQASDPKQTPIVIASVPQQTIEYFGASGAWWPNDLNYFPPEQQLNLSQLLFSQDWLYLSGYRYNMGASGDNDNVTVHTDDVPVSRGVESFMKTDGSFDWTRDGPGIYYLKAAVAANVSSITFFVNAAPSGLNATTEYLTPCSGTLETTAISGFVTYIETVVAHWTDQGIRIDYISPMNEPDNSFSSCGQEGMAVQQSDRTTVFQQLRLALSNSRSAAAKAVKIMGDETSQIASQALLQYGNWLPQTLTNQSIDAIAVHMYDFPDDPTILNYAQLVKNSSSGAPPPAIHMTEVSSFQSAPGIHSEWGWTGPHTMTSQYDPSISSALDLARMIWQFLTLANASSFSWWTAISTMMPSCSSSAPGTTCSSAKTIVNGTGWNDALIYIDPSYPTTKNYEFYLTKRFWVFKHFTTFHRPGSIRHDIPNAVLPYGTVAIASSTGPTINNNNNNNIWQVTFINRNDTAQEVTLKLPGIATTTTGAKVQKCIQTTNDVDWGDVALPTVDAKNQIALTLPARGVLTVQFSVSASVSTSSRGPISGRRIQTGAAAAAAAADAEKKRKEKARRRASKSENKASSHDAASGSATKKLDR